MNSWTDLPLCNGAWDVNLNTGQAHCAQAVDVWPFIALLLGALASILALLLVFKLQPKLASVRIFWRKNTMPVQGPLTLNVGQKSTATLIGFDQFGNQIAIDPATISWADDNEAAAQDAPAPDGSDVITGIAPGVSNLVGSVKLPNGQVISSQPDPITVQAVPVLTSVQISLTPPA